jgi:hypothetical protein
VNRWEAPHFDTLLARADTLLQCHYLPEPSLFFAGKQQCEDPRTGLTAYGPYSKSEASRHQQIRIGIVGRQTQLTRRLGFSPACHATVPGVQRRYRPHIDSRRRI